MNFPFLPGAPHRGRLPRHVLQRNGGLAEIWNLDDVDILCHPLLVLTHLRVF